MREAEIPIVSDAECIRKVNAVTEKIFILPASSFCAGGEEGNDACQVFCVLFFIFKNLFIHKYLTNINNKGMKNIFCIYTATYISDAL